MAKRLTIHLNNKPIYDIVIKNNFDDITNELNRLDLSGRKLCIVTDSNVNSLYADELSEKLTDCGLVYKFVFSAGEANKNLNTVQSLYEYLIINKFERRDLLIALGGGVVGDLTGFTAATYLRGIDFIQIPTTLLAQVDSSIGGKTGVDFSSYKNMVGAFYMPKLVYMNINTLNSLDERIFNEGFGEIIKHGFIRNRDYLQYINDNLDNIKARNYECMEHIIYESCKIKAQVVENDPTEKGERAILNFGHTLGHSIEKLTNFNYYHGECVILGMICSLAICQKRGLIEKNDFNHAMDLFNSFGFPLFVTGITAEQIIETARNDKKMDKGIIKFILLNGIGNAFIDRSVTDLELSDSLKYVIRQD